MLLLVFFQLKTKDICYNYSIWVHWPLARKQLISYLSYRAWQDFLPFFSPILYISVFQPLASPHRQWSNQMRIRYMWLLPLTNCLSSFCFSKVGQIFPLEEFSYAVWNKAQRELKSKSRWNKCRLQEIKYLFCNF